ncbi:MAG TPA: NAD-dependent epimerase/dehydratase family protein [candidate division Zixibacteria bacterium]|nr:NAD-dependent epimerase/dehydratase family protein [candidate division Zixibacteria bacterium]
MDANSYCLVLGATGSIGSAFVTKLLETGRPVTALVRKREKALNLFGENPKLEVAEGDALDSRLVSKLAKGKNFIFHGINFPYDKWEGNMENATRNVINAARENKATILFPGNVYNYGMTSPIYEDSKPAPITKKGRIRVELELMLKDAVIEGGCRVLLLRLPDFFGPNVTNGLMMPIFKNALEGKPMKWLIRTDIPHQLVYILDAGELFVRLMYREDLANYEEINFGGITVSSVEHWLRKIAELAGTQPKIKTISKLAITILSPFVPIVREIKEMAYLFENNIQLNDDKLRGMLPHFKPTPMQDANRETLDWFKKHVLA